MFKKYQLKNGMKVLLIESHKSPVLSIQMWVKTGSADEKRGEEGISHFIEHLVFKGSRKYGVGEIAATVEGAGGELNAYTSFDQTVFYVTISKEFQDTGLDVISEMMGFPSFDKQEIDNEREVVIEEIKRSNDSPHRQASRLLFTAFYKKHPYGIPVIGYEKNINTVSRAKLLKYYKDRYNPKNMTLVVAGDFHGSEFKKRIESFFASFSVSKLKVVKRKKNPKSKRANLVVKQAPFEETIMHLAFPAPKASHKDVAALETLALILGQGESSRLNQKMRVDRHLVNSVGAGLFLARDPGFFSFSASLNAQELGTTLGVLREELARIVADPVSEEELSKAMTNLAAEQYYHQETVDGLARTFGNYQDLFGDPSYFEKFIRTVQKLTVKDLQKAARKYFSDPGFSFVVMTPVAEKTVSPLLQDFVVRLKSDLKKAVVRKGRSVAKKGKKTTKSHFIFHKPANLKEEVKKIKLPSGATLIVRPNFDTPVISIRCASLGGTRLENEQTQGATELLSRVWTAGCGPYSEAQMNHKIDALASSLGAFGGRNSEGLSMSSLRAFESEMVDLFCLTLSDPHFEEAAITREKKAMIEQVKLRKDNPAQLCVLEFMKALFGDHPYGRDPYGTETSIDQLNRQKVQEVFGLKSGLTIVASGALDPNELAKRFERELSGLSIGPERVALKPILYPRKETCVFMESAKQQSHVIMGFPGLTLKDPQRYTLQVMQAILAGQGGRLFLELRDKASLAYSVSPMRMEGLEGGYFGAYIGCSPEKVDKALSMMRVEFDKLCSTLVSDAELARAQRYLIGKHDIELQKNSNITSSILFDDIYGIDFMETYRFPDLIRAVNSNDIRTLAARLFAQPVVVSQVGPGSPAPELA